VRISDTEHHLATAQLGQLAALAVVQRLAEFEEGHDGEVK
jgi:hypothetical protein